MTTSIKTYFDLHHNIIPVAQWVALSSRSKEVPGSSAFCVELACSYCVCVCCVPHNQKTCSIGEMEMPKNCL